MIPLFHFENVYTNLLTVKISCKNKITPFPQSNTLYQAIKHQVSNIADSARLCLFEFVRTLHKLTTWRTNTHTTLAKFFYTYTLGSIAKVGWNFEWGGCRYVTEGFLVLNNNNMFIYFLNTNVSGNTLLILIHRENICEKLVTEIG